MRVAYPVSRYNCGERHVAYRLAVPAAADPPAAANQPPPQPNGKLNPFDQAVSLRILSEAADDYASRYGQRGSSPYRVAWLRFRRHIQSIDDLHRMRAQAARPSVRTQAKRTQAKR